jgi:hypothetical protein
MYVFTELSTTMYVVMHVRLWPGTVTVARCPKTPNNPWPALDFWTQVGRRHCHRAVTVAPSVCVESQIAPARLVTPSRSPSESAPAANRAVQCRRHRVPRAVQPHIRGTTTEPRSAQADGSEPVGDRRTLTDGSQGAGARHSAGRRHGREHGPGPGPAGSEASTITTSNAVQLARRQPPPQAQRRLWTQIIGQSSRLSMRPVTVGVRPELFVLRNCANTPEW